MRAFALQICGTGSGVGKSVIVSALCRIFLQDGYRVCPFKAQNMALNSFVTKESGEIGRAQAVQAQACRIEPSVDMNPVLIKPTSDVRAQIIVRGSPVAGMDARRYINYKNRLLKVVRGSFERLARDYEIVVMEGAGSPAEINLKSHDIVNLKMAKYAKAPVILVGDIDKGGVFASLVGTLELLEKEERKMIKGFIINKFRGDITLLKPGIDFLEKRTGIKVLGTIPYFSNAYRAVSKEKAISIPEEDSVPRDDFMKRQTRKQRKLNVAVVYLPHISNFTDFDALRRETDVVLRYVDSPEAMGNPDIIIIPGTKNTVSDLSYLKGAGLTEKILAIMNRSKSAILIGICGGFQMLGTKLCDPKGIESKKKESSGLGLLPMATNFAKDKILSQVKAREIKSGLEVRGYQIRHGRAGILRGLKPVFNIIERHSEKIEDYDGMITEDGRIWGTYIHGIFDSDTFRRDFLNRIRLKKGWPALSDTRRFDADREFDKLAGLVRENIDMEYLYKILKSGN